MCKYCRRIYSYNLVNYWPGHYCGHGERDITASIVVILIFLLWIYSLYRLWVGWVTLLIVMESLVFHLQLVGASLAGCQVGLEGSTVSLCEMILNMRKLLI